MGSPVDPFRANMHTGLQFHLKLSEYGEETTKRIYKSVTSEAL